MTNPFRLNVVDAIRQEKAKASPQFATLVEYVAASGLLHVADSTRYIGRSLLSASLSDIHSARHLAYYAELRAAMSILACSGVGVFDRSHVVVSNASQIDFIDARSTHEFVWLAFADWAKSQHAVQVVSSAITVAGKSLGEAVAAASSGYSISAAIDGWMRDWGMDLSSLADDKDRRNESSYRPTDMEPVGACSLATTIKFTDDFWSLFDPSLLTRFSALDEQLARSALETVQSRRNLGLQSSDVDSIMSAMGLTPPSDPRVQRVLMRTGSFKDDSAILQYARRPRVHSDPTLHLSMISRAALLSRIAIGAVVDLVSSSGVHAGELDFWLEEFALTCGLWSARPPDLQDLWIDVDSSLTSIRGANYAMSQESWSQKFAREIVILGEFERVAVWGLAS